MFVLQLHPFSGAKLKLRMFEGLLASPNLKQPTLPGNPHINTKQNRWTIPSWELTYPFSKAVLKMSFQVPKVGYVNSLEGNSAVGKPFLWFHVVTFQQFTVKWPHEAHSWNCKPPSFSPSENGGNLTSHLVNPPAESEELVATKKKLLYILSMKYWLFHKGSSWFFIIPT